MRRIASAAERPVPTMTIGRAVDGAETLGASEGAGDGIAYNAGGLENDDDGDDDGDGGGETSEV